MDNLLKPRQCSIALALLAVLTLTSCGKKAETPDAGATASPDTTSESSTSNDSTESGSNASICAEAAKLGGMGNG